MDDEELNARAEAEYRDYHADVWRQEIVADGARDALDAITRERQLVALWLNSLAGETVDPLEVARMVLNGVHAVGEL